MTHNTKSTRYYSSKQEKNIAKTLSGKQVSNSGATRFNKGDVCLDDWLIEAKTSIEPKKSFAIKQDWLDKNKEEAFAMHKPYSALAFQFGPGLPNYYVISEKLFKQLVEYLKEENNQ